MLPRPNGIRVADQDRASRNECSNRVGDDPVRRPVTTTDDVPCANGRNRGPISEVARAVGRSHELRSRLARAVGITPPEAIAFPECLTTLGVLVHLVASDDDHSANRTASPGGFEEVDGPH